MGKEAKRDPFPDMELYEANIPLPERPWTVDGIQAVSDYVSRRHDSTKLLSLSENYDAPYKRQAAVDGMNA